MNYPNKRLEIRARIREQPKVQGGQIHHRTCPHDKGNFLFRLLSSFIILILIIFYHSFIIAFTHRIIDNFLYELYHITSHLIKPSNPDIFF